MTISSYNLEVDEKKLKELLVKTGAFRYSPDKKFKLASGVTSEYYFDLKSLNGDPEGINMVAKIFYNYIKQFPEVKAVGGLESGSISIATAISQLSYYEHRKDSSNPLITSFYVRKEPKTHGTQELIEGKIKSPVVIVDDVITSGLSAITAVNAIKKASYDCKCLLSIIFRGTDSQRKSIEKDNQFKFIFREDQITEHFRQITA